MISIRILLNRTFSNKNQVLFIRTFSNKNQVLFVRTFFEQKSSSIPEDFVQISVAEIQRCERSGAIIRMEIMKAKKKKIEEKMKYSQTTCRNVAGSYKDQFDEIKHFQTRGERSDGYVIKQNSKSNFFYKIIVLRRISMV